MADLNLYTSGNVGNTSYAASLPLVVTGQPASATKVYAAFDRLADTMRTLEDANMGVSETLDWTKVRPGGVVDAWTVGGTANMDFLAYQFDDASNAWGLDDPHDATGWISIPGAGWSRYLKKPAVALITWNITGLADGSNGLNSCAWALQVNGVVQDALTRIVRPTDGPAVSFAGYKGQRSWCGHVVFRLDAGWNHINLVAHATSSATKVFRQWVRSLQVQVFHIGDEMPSYSGLDDPDT